MNYAQIVANNMKKGLENESEQISEISRVLDLAGISAIQHWHLMNDADFIPDVLNREVFDELVPVSDDRSIEVSQELAAREGIFAGISSGATLAAALEVAKSAADGSVILAMLPDTGERYLSTPLFENVNEGSDDEWLATL